MLPPIAETYYRQELARAFADAASEFAMRLEQFDRTEQQRGGAFGGTGYVARLANEYVGELGRRSVRISALLQRVHGEFDSPLEEGVEGQLAGWGLASLDAQLASLTEQFGRRLRSYGMAPAELGGASIAMAAHRASIPNEISHCLWTMRYVPVKHPSRNTLHSLVVNGPVGAIQFGGHSTANVQQVVPQAEGPSASEALQSALAELLSLLKERQQIDASVREDAIRALEDVAREASKDRPDKSKVGALLSSIATLIQTIPAAPQAWATVTEWSTLLGR